MHLREKADDELTLCIRPVAISWLAAQPVGRGAASGTSWCWYCRCEMDKKVGSPVYLAARKKSCSLDETDYNALYLESFNRRLSVADTTQLARAEILRELQADALAETVSPLIAARLLQLSPENRFHWMSCADGFGVGPSLRGEIIDRYGEADTREWPSESELDNIYERLISTYYRSYSTCNLRFFIPIFVVAHIWPEALRGYEPGIDPLLHATTLLDELLR